MRKRSGPNKRLLPAIFASFALGLTSIAGVLGALAGEKDDLQAPRGIRYDSSPRLNDSMHAPRGEDTQAPRGGDTQVPRGQETQAPRGQDTQAPRDEHTQAPRGIGATVRGE